VKGNGIAALPQTRKEISGENRIGKLYRLKVSDLMFIPEFEK